MPSTVDNQQAVAPVWGFRSAAGLDVEVTPTKVPVLLISGPVGAGKTTIAGEIGELLREAGVPHAVVDLAVIGQCWPPPGDDPWNERLIHRNLAAMWDQFREAGARRLVLSRVLESRGLLRRVGEAVPGAEITVVHLRVTLPMLHARLRRREAGDPAWYLDAATRLTESMLPGELADHVVDNDERPAREVAAEILRRAGWPPDLSTGSPSA